LKEPVPELSFIPADKLIKNYSPEIRELKRKSFNEMRRLWSRHDFESLIDIGSLAIEELPQIPEGNGDKEISGIYMLLGSAIWAKDKDKEKTLLLAKKAVQFDRHCKGAMWLLRECMGKFSENSIYYRILVKGKLYVKAGDEYNVHTFHSAYGVVAQSPDEAMEFIRDFEREEICNNLELTSVEDIDAKPELPMGVYAVSELIT